MATTLDTSQIPEPFRGLLSPVKQDAIEEKTENKVSLLGIDISSTHNFMALSESYFIVKMWYEVKDNRNHPNTGDYRNWITPTSPAFSWVKNIRVELNIQEVTQSGVVADMQQVQHILSFMKSSIGKVQHAVVTYSAYKS